MGKWSVKRVKKKKKQVNDAFFAFCVFVDLLQKQSLREHHRMIFNRLFNTPSKFSKPAFFFLLKDGSRPCSGEQKKCSRTRLWSERIRFLLSLFWGSLSVFLCSRAWRPLVCQSLLMHLTVSRGLESRLKQIRAPHLPPYLHPINYSRTLIRPKNLHITIKRHPKRSRKLNNNTITREKRAVCQACWERVQGRVKAR